MKRSFLTFLTVIALSGSIGVANAQPAAQSVDIHSAPANGSPAANSAFLNVLTPVGRQDEASSPTTNVDTGWYYLHAGNCWTYFDGTLTWFYLFSLEGYSVFTANPMFQNSMSPACQTGNTIAFYVFNTRGNWNQVFTFTSR
jgi:hypothetical protein